MFQEQQKIQYNKIILYIIQLATVNALKRQNIVQGIPNLPSKIPDIFCIGYYWFKLKYVKTAF